MLKVHSVLIFTLPMPFQIIQIVFRHTEIWVLLDCGKPYPKELDFYAFLYAMFLSEPIKN